MTPDHFRRIALSMPEAVEVYRLGHSQFRVGRTTFATLEGVADSIATVRLTPDQQAMFIERAPAVFAPMPGSWGSLGSTIARLATANPAIVEEALAAAWSNAAPKSLLKRIDKPPRS
jgi:hypothetical protein